MQFSYSRPLPVIACLLFFISLETYAIASLDEDSDVEYCAMVRIHDESNGLFGWEPDKRGRDGCTDIRDQCQLMNEYAYTEWTAGVLRMEDVDRQCQNYFWYYMGSQNDHFDN